MTAGEGFGLLDTEMDDFTSHYQPRHGGTGNGIGWIFAAWLRDGRQPSSITGLVAKENAIVATVGILTSLGDVGRSRSPPCGTFAASLQARCPAIAFCAL